MKVAIIGNGTPTDGNGIIIDTFDEVVRLNGGGSPNSIRGKETSVGTKSTINCINTWSSSKYTVKIINEAVDYANENNIKLLYASRKLIKWPENKLDSGIPIGFKHSNDIGTIPRSIYRRIKGEYNYKYPTTGLAVVFYFLEQGYEEVGLFNFTFNGTHYFDNEWYDPMTDTNSVQNEDSRSAELEFNIIKNLASKGLINIY